MPIEEQDATQPLPNFAEPADVQDFAKGKLKASEPRVKSALAAVSASMREYAGWHIWPLLKGDVRILDGDGGRIQPLPTLKLVRLVAVNNAGEMLDPDTVDVSSAGLMERTDHAPWTGRMGRLYVTMDHGHKSVPALQALCVALVARGLASPLGATQESAGSLSVSWGSSGSISGGLQPYSAEKATMAGYKLPGV